MVGCQTSTVRLRGWRRSTRLKIRPRRVRIIRRSSRRSASATSSPIGSAAPGTTAATCSSRGSTACRSATSTSGARRSRSRSCGPRIPDAPLLNHLEVQPDWRGRASAPRSCGACEAAARRRGYDILLLGVGVDNPEAKRLYERLGYLDWGHGPIVARWTEPDGRGGIRFAELTCDTMVRSLLAPPVSAWDAWQPAEIAERLAGVAAPWHVAGGWALELWRQTRGLGPIRTHGDVGDRRPAARLSRRSPQRWPSSTCTPSGSARSGRSRPARRHRTASGRCGSRSGGAYRVDLFLEPGDGADVDLPAGRADHPAVRRGGRAYRATAFRFCAPNACCSTRPGRRRLPKDEVDFAAVAPAPGRRRPSLARRRAGTRATRSIRGSAALPR